MKLSSLKQQIEELDAKATNGPWRNGPDPYDAGILSKGGTLVAGLGPTESYDTFIANRDFIALSRIALPELLRRLLVAEEALLNAESALHWALDKKPSACRCVSFSTPPHVCVAHKAINEAIDALKTIRGEEE